jgi:alkylhydroperoxidase family enzyme
MLARMALEPERSTAGGLPLPADAELSPETRSILARMPPLNVFRAVAAVPAALRPFLQLGGALLGGEHLTAAERELAILRVAHRTHASYERHQHEQLGRLAGLSDAEIAATADVDEEVLSDDQRLICRASDEITASVRLSDETLADLRARWGDDGARELILLVGYYNMVSRFLESARVPIEDADHLGDGFRRRSG